MEIEDVIKLWKKLGIKQAVFEFDCGGDSMGNTELSFFDENEEEINSSELESYFDKEVYDRVQFYVNSDGHYQGESGKVYITLEEEEEDFDYSKDAQSEFNETYDSTTEFEMPEEMISFIKENISNINGSQDGAVINFKRDLILSEKQEELLEKIEQFLTEKTNEYCPDLEIESEWDEWFTFTTNGKGKTLTINDNKLEVHMSNQYIKYEPSED